MHLEKRVLVTGGAGFLGSHLCERLIKDGATVLCVDNFFTGARRNIEHLIEHKHFDLMRHDVTFALYVEVDEIYNLACPASPIHYQHDPVQTTKTSVHGAINMLGLAKRLRAKILQASTSEVYGDPDVQPQSEEYWGRVNPIGVRSCYDEGKRCAETLFFDYWREHRLRIKVARIFNTYGPRMHPNDGRVAGPINIGNPEEYTMLELAQLIIDLTGSKSRMVHKPRPQDDPRQRRPDISNAKKLLGWGPSTPVAEGMKRTIAYFERLLREPGLRARLAAEQV
jgi:UDP-glucuronate decarboxylase